MEFPHERRVEALRDSLDPDEAVVVTSGPNARYLTGFAGEGNRPFLALVRPGSDPIAFTPATYDDQVADGVWFDDVRAVAENANDVVLDGLLAELGNHDGTLFLDPHAVAEVALGVRSGCPDASIRLAGERLDDLRVPKGDAELDALRRAAGITDRVSEGVRALGPEAVGMTEREVAAEIRTRLYAEGADDLSFAPVVAAGPDAARAGYRHGEREIRAGEPVVLDFGAVVEGYANDQTRTVVFEGEPSREFEAAYDAVVAALDAGVEAAGVGVQVGDVDDAVRAAIDDRGFLEHYVRSTGHGIGLESIEPPVLDSPADARRPMPDGAVVTIEPGLYFEGEFGVRVEDAVAVTDEGAERLNGSPMTWRALR